MLFGHPNFGISISWDRYSLPWRYCKEQTALLVIVRPGQPYRTPAASRLDTTHVFGRSGSSDSISAQEIWIVQTPVELPRFWQSHQSRSPPPIAHSKPSRVFIRLSWVVAVSNAPDRPCLPHNATPTVWERACKVREAKEVV